MNTNSQSINQPLPNIGRITLRDIAKRAGVSHVTVSLALKNHPEISSRRRQEIQTLAKEMGYRPDPMLASLVVYRHSKRPVAIQSSIAWLNHWRDPKHLRRLREFEAYWQGAFQSAERFGYRLDEVVLPEHGGLERLERVLHARNIQGILIPPHPAQPEWGDFPWQNFSVIRFGLSVRCPSSHVVTSDQMQGVMLAVRKIKEYGYERIGFVVPRDFDYKLGGSYTGGFFAAQQLLELHTCIPPLTSLERNHREKPNLVFREFERWYMKHKPDAILTATAEVFRFLERMRISVPEELAVAGTSVYDIPATAGINQNSEEIGRVAVETLVALINANDRGCPLAPRRILVEGWWQDGESLPDRRAASLMKVPAGVC